MKQAPQINHILYNNILYIGDEPRACLSVIDDFNNRLKEIESRHKEWFTNRVATNGGAGHDKLQRHIHYHFEGGIAVFKFKNDDDLPLHIRKECLMACQNLVEEQLYYAS